MAIVFPEDENGAGVNGIVGEVENGESEARVWKQGLRIGRRVSRLPETPIVEDEELCGDQEDQVQPREADFESLRFL